MSASEKMFDWFINNSTSRIPKLLENNIVRNTAWQMCASDIRAIVEEGLRVTKTFSGELCRII